MKNFIPLTAIKKSLLLALFVVASLGVQAQLLDPADYNEPSGMDQTDNTNNQIESGLPNLDNPTGGGDVPVDGGLGFLLAAGVGYGANKLRKYRKEKRTFDQ